MVLGLLGLLVVPLVLVLLGLLGVLVSQVVLVDLGLVEVVVVVGEVVVVVEVEEVEEVVGVGEVEVVQLRSKQVDMLEHNQLVRHMVNHIVVLDVVLPHLWKKR